MKRSARLRPIFFSGAIWTLRQSAVMSARVGTTVTAFAEAIAISRAQFGSFVAMAAVLSAAQAAITVLLASIVICGLMLEWGYGEQHDDGRWYEAGEFGSG